MLLKEILKKVIADLENRKPYPEISTTLKSLDKLLWGIHKKELLVIGGRTSEGKTSLATQMAYRMSVICNVVFITLEMTNEQMAERILCNEYNISSEEIRVSKNLSDEKKQLIDKTNNKLLILDDVGNTPQSLEKAIMGLRPLPDVLFIDHLHRISVKHGNRLESLDEYVRFLKDFAKRNNIAIVLVAQLNRGAEDSDRPHLWQLKGCGTIEEEADTVLLIWNHKDETHLLIEKQRHGPVGKIQVLFDKEYFRFSEIF